MEIEGPQNIDNNQTKQEGVYAQWKKPQLWILHYLQSTGIQLLIGANMLQEIIELFDKAVPSFEQGRIDLKGAMLTLNDLYGKRKTVINGSERLCLKVERMNRKIPYQSVQIAFLNNYRYYSQQPIVQCLDGINNICALVVKFHYSDLVMQLMSTLKQVLNQQYCLRVCTFEFGYLNMLVNNLHVDLLCGLGQGLQILNLSFQDNSFFNNKGFDAVIEFLRTANGLIRLNMNTTNTSCSLTHITNLVNFLMEGIEDMENMHLKQLKQFHFKHCVFLGGVQNLKTILELRDMKCTFQNQVHQTVYEK